MPQYELLYIVGAQYTDEELNPIKQKTREMIESAQGKILLDDSLGKKKLAYPIKKYNQGYYLLNHFEMDKKNLEKLEKNLRLSEDIVRHIILKYEPRAAVTLEKIKEGFKSAAETPFIKPASPKIEKLAEKPEKEKTKLEDLDKKLDELLKGDNLL